MAIYNNPMMAQAAQNLASIWAPPSGSDLAGYANAGATREQAARIAELYASGLSPSEKAALIGVQNFGQTPEGFRFDVNARSGDNRYASDRSYDANIGVAKINNAGALERQNAAPILIDENQTAVLPQQTQAATGLGQFIMGQSSVGQGETVMRPDGTVVEGRAPNMTPDQFIGSQMPRLHETGQITDEQLIESVFGGNDPEISGYDNYTVLTPAGEVSRALGRVDPRTGQVFTPAGEDITARVVSREGTGGGITFEADGEGGVRFTTGGAGGTVSNTTNLLGTEREAQRVANELSLLYDTILADDVGVAGNINQALTDYGAQVFPNVARGDVAAMRSQIEATSIQLARSLSGDSRISNIDREIAQRASVGTGLDESVEGAKSKLAALIALHAYRSAYAGGQLGGETLPPLDAAMLGQLVDEGRLSPAVAQRYHQDILSRRRAPSGGPSVGPTAPTPPTPPGPPSPATGTQSQANPEIFSSIPPQSGTPAAPVQAVQEGATAINPTTGQRIVFRNGQWEAL